MARIKYIYSVYDISRKTHIAFFSSLDKASKFVLAHGIKVRTYGWNRIPGYSHTGKHSAAIDFSSINSYTESNTSIHLYVKIPLDENGQLKF
ncbi:MAG: hypothetical protein RBQ91_00425 [Acholeplasma sp.]|nr:hypothetical protein [Acholeplasma sp.]